MNFDIDTEEGMANAVAWQENLISKIVPGGRWLVPRSGTICILDQENKRVRMLGLLPEPTVERVFKAMGWTVERDA